MAKTDPDCPVCTCDTEPAFVFMDVSIVRMEDTGEFALVLEASDGTERMRAVLDMFDTYEEASSIREEFVPELSKAMGEEGTVGRIH